MVNTNIIVGPNYLGHITADVIMDRIEAVVCSNNFIPANRGLQINIAAIKNIKGLKYGSNSNGMKDINCTEMLLLKCYIVMVCGQYQ